MAQMQGERVAEASGWGRGAGGYGSARWVEVEGCGLKDFGSQPKTQKKIDYFDFCWGMRT